MMPTDRTITTDRLFLTPFAPEHADALYTMNSDPEVMRYLGEPQTRAQIHESITRVQARWAKHGFAWWSVFLKDTDTQIGAACLQHLAHKEDAALEVGWRLMLQHQGKGYATEAGRAALNFGFDVIDADYLCAVTHPENIGSQRVMQRLGMSYVGVQTHYDQDCVYYDLVKSE